MCFSAGKKSVRSKAIDEDLRHDAKDINDSVKLLLLGSGDTGKTTLAKQLMLAFTDQDLESKYVVIARTNVLYVFKGIFEYLNSIEFDFPIQTQKNVQLVSSALDFMAPGVTAACLVLRECAFIHKSLEESGDFMNIPGGRDGGKYFLAKIEEYADPLFKPTTEDILRARTKTTGIHETVFPYGGKEIMLVDVGGQRPERRKWMSAISGSIVAVIYLSSLSDYNTVLEEDRVTNRLTDSINLFKALQTSPHLVNVPFVVLLNKCDIFKKKIVQTPLQEVFPEYPSSSKGTEDPDELYQQSVDYISNLFQSEAASSYIRPSNLLDSECCANTWKNVWEQVIQPRIQSLDPIPMT